MPRRTRRALPGVVLAAALLLSACGGGSSAAPAASEAPASSAGAVAITHKFGTTTVPANPARVLTVGYNEQDFAIALGVEPVGVREFLGYDAPQRPWLPEDLRGKSLPTVGSQEIAFEQVATSARTGRNPQTGEEIAIPAGKRVKVTAGSKLKAAVK